MATHAYHILGMCKVTISNEGIEYQYNFFVVPGNEPALLGMPDCEWLQLLSINCQDNKQSM